MAKKPNAKVVSKKAPVALKKATAEKAVARKVAAKKAPSKKVVARKRPSSSSTSAVRLGWTIGVFGVENGVAGLTIDGLFYPCNDQMGYPICLLFPIKPEPGRDAEYEAALNDAINSLPPGFRGIQHCATCCN